MFPTANVIPDGTKVGGASAAHPVAHQFVDADQQHVVAELGMWVFLVTEVMFFGAFFLAYLVYREWYPAAFAQGSRHMDVLLGTVNTGVLLTSSFTMALAVHAAEHSQRRWLMGMLAVTMILGTLFVGIKGWEYYHKYEEHLVPFAGWTFAPEGSQRDGMVAFFNIYFLMTGLHAFHMLIGLVMLAMLFVMAYRSQLPRSRSIVVHNAGLYWHFVDLVWVYLFPFFYLVSTRTAGTP